MVRAFFRTLVVAWCLGGATASLAGTVAGLYDAQYPVTEQSAQSLKQAAAAGLEEVFVRVSGRRDVREHPAIISALATPEPFLTRYRYQRANSDQGEGLLVDMSFAPGQVNAVLQSAFLPVWSANRPEVIVWLVVDTAAGRNFVAAGADPRVEAELQAQAQRRGLALQFPLFDLVDAANLTTDQVWQMSIEDVKAASERYSPPYVLMGRASEFSTGQWVASWVLLSEDGYSRLDSQGQNSEEMLSPVVDLIADIQGRRYAAVAGGRRSGNTLIHIGGVDDFSEYAHLLSYMEGLAMVEHANTVWLDGAELVMELVLKDDVEKVRRYLALDGRLREVQNASGAITPMAVQSYYLWQGRE